MKIIFLAILCLSVLGCTKKDTEIGFFAGETGRGEIHYFKMDVSISNGYYLDIDGDKTNDLLFFCGSYHVDPVVYGEDASIMPTKLYGSLYICVNDSGSPLVLQKGDMINSSSRHWLNRTYMYPAGFLFFSDGYNGIPYYGTYGEVKYGRWLNIHDGYVGFKIIGKSKTTWGWIQVDNLDHEQLTLKGYAYLEM